MLRTLVAALLAAAALPLPAHAETIMIRAGRLITDAARAPTGPATITVTDGRIVAVGPADAPAPAGARVIDLSTKTVLPGLIDAHVHLTGDPQGAYWQEAVETDEHMVAVGLKNALLTVRAGFTTVRDLGSSPLTGFAVRDAIREKLQYGPRVVAAGPPISIIGGHGDFTNFRPEVIEALSLKNTCTGAVECAARVREAARRGADVIKFTATGGVLSQQKGGLGAHFTQEEMNSIAGTAKSLGLRSAAHAHGADGVLEAARAGASSIEHGVFADDAALREMKARGTFLVPTLMALTGLNERIGKNFYTPPVEAKGREVLARWGVALKRANELGVRVAFGTDAGVFEHGRNAGEFRLMVEKGGMTQQAALVAATTGAAELLDLPDVGRIAPGMAADIIAVSGDPQRDPDALNKVDFVMAAGRVVPLSD